MKLPSHTKTPTSPWSNPNQSQSNSDLKSLTLFFCDCLHRFFFVSTFTNPYIRTQGPSSRLPPQKLPFQTPFCSFLHVSFRPLYLFTPLFIVSTSHLNTHHIAFVNISHRPRSLSTPSSSVQSCTTPSPSAFRSIDVNAQTTSQTDPKTSYRSNTLSLRSMNLLYKLTQTASWSWSSTNTIQKLHEDHKPRCYVHPFFIFAHIFSTDVLKRNLKTNEDVEDGFSKGSQTGSSHTHLPPHQLPLPPSTKDTHHIPPKLLNSSNQPIRLPQLRQIVTAPT